MHLREIRHVASTDGSADCQRMRATSCESNLAIDWAESNRWLQSQTERQYNTRPETNETILFLGGGRRTAQRQSGGHGHCGKAVRLTFRAIAW